MHKWTRCLVSVHRWGLLCLCLSVLVACADVDIADPSEDSIDSPDTETEVPPTGGIEGIVEPEGIGATVLVVQELDVLRNVTTDPQGHYRIADLPVGDYDLEILAPNHFADISQRDLQVVADEWIQADPVVLRPWSEAATFRGIVVDDRTGQPLDRVSILVECTTSVCSPVSASTEADGTFEIEVWPDLASNVLIRKAGYRQDFIHIDALGLQGDREIEIRLEKQ